MPTTELISRSGSAVERKSRGAFFTPPEVASFIADWCIRDPDDRVLEPSCGEAEFLLAAGRRLKSLGRDDMYSGQIVGVELHAPSALAAEALLAQEGLEAAVETMDFFDFEDQKRFDAVIGNPPYIRFQEFSGPARTKARAAALKVGVRIDGLASSWAAFTIKAAAQVEEGGRLGLVLPAELLSVNYASAVREYLLKRFASVKLVMFDERVFADALADTLLLLAEGSGPAESIDIQAARNLAGLDDRAPVRWAPPTGEAKWTPALLDTQFSANYAEITQSCGFDSLNAWGRIDLGAVTGNNRFFCLSAESVARHGIPPKELVRLSPPGSAHLRGLEFSVQAWNQLRDSGRPCFIVQADEEEPSDQVAAWTRLGIELGVNEGYKCQKRNPWWRVPLPETPDAFFTYMNHAAPQICTNTARVTHVNSVHGVHFKPGIKQVGRELLPIAALNSVSLLGAELVGRSYGGGVLKLEPSEALQLPLPPLSAIRENADRLRAIRPHLAKHLRSGDVLAASKLVDDALLIEGLGINRAALRDIRSARGQLLDRRLSRN